MFRALRRRRNRRRDHSGSELSPREAALAPDEGHAEPGEPRGENAAPAGHPDPESDVLGDRPLAEMLLTNVVDPFDPRDDVELAAIEGVSEVPLSLGHAPQAPADAPPIDDARDRVTHSPLFASVAIETLTALKERVEVRRVAEGEYVFREGEDGATLYVVASGAFVPEAYGEGTVRLSVIGEGECFGEVGLLTGGPRSASVRALVDSEVLVIEAQILEPLMQRDPQLLETLSRRVHERIVDRLLQTNVLFTACDRATRNEIARLFRLIEVQDATLLVEQGAPAPAFFLILNGAVRVLRDDGVTEKELAMLGPGGFFGEMSLLDHSPAVADVIALGRSWMLALPRSRFEALLARDPSLASHVHDVALMRHHQNHLAFRAATPAHGRVELI